MEEPYDGRPLSLKAVAKLLGLHPRTLARWIERGRFPPAARLPGGRKYWTKRDLDSWLHLNQRGMFAGNDNENHGGPE
jgi:excisionase family DNA binding protein